MSENGEPRWIISKDGRAEATADSENDALAVLHRLQGQSWQHAIAHEGWTVEQAQPWPSDYAANEAAMARQIVNLHEHARHDNSQLSRENCAACVLGGYLPRREMRDPEHDFSDGPNYAGWARVLTQALVPVRPEWKDAYERERRSDNAPYSAALERDIATFGLSVDRGRYRA